MNFSLLDFIDTEEGTYHGVIDYSSTKHITLFDLSQNDDPDLVMMIMLWKLYYSDMRFSIFHSVFFPNKKIPEPILISKKNITDIRTDFSIKTKPKSKKSKVKNN